MLGFIITLIIIGLIAGFIARALVPGDDSMSIPATIAPMIEPMMPAALR